MNIAVTYDNGQIFQHFGHCATFKLYQAQEGRILREEIIDASGSGHEALAGLLNDFDVDVLICGGIGGGAKMALAQAGIRLYPSVSGNADASVKAFLEGRLDYDPNAQCSHHGNGHHHGQGHQGGCHGAGGHQGGCHHEAGGHQGGCQHS